MTFDNAVRVNLQKFFTATGRATRSEFWWYFLLCYVVIGVLGTIGGFVSGHGGIEQTWVGVVFDVLAAVIGISVICSQIRRLHDADKSGWNVLWGLIPIIGQIYLIVLLCKPTYPEANQYGNVPVD